MIMYPMREAKKARKKLTLLANTAARMAGRLGIGQGCYTINEDDETIVFEWFQTVGVTEKGHKVKLPMKLTVVREPLKWTATWAFQGVANVTTADPTEWLGVEKSLVTKLRGLRYDHCAQALKLRGNGSEALFLKQQRQFAELHARMVAAEAALEAARKNVDNLRRQIFYLSQQGETR